MISDKIFLALTKIKEYIEHFFLLFTGVNIKNN